MGSRCWLNKRDEVQAIMDDLDPDIMYIMEAHIFKNDPEYLVNIDIPQDMDKCKSGVCKNYNVDKK